MLNQDNDPGQIFAGIRLAEFDVRFVDLMQKDSLDMETQDIEAIVNAVRDCHDHGERVLVIVGTDRLALIAYVLEQEALGADGLVVLTGAMVPTSGEGSDGPQNIAQALLWLSAQDRGVFTVFHNQVFIGGALNKDYDAMTFTPFPPEIPKTECDVVHLDERPT